MVLIRNNTKKSHELNPDQREPEGIQFKAAKMRIKKRTEK